MVLGANKTLIPVLKNPTRQQMLTAIKKWKNKCRGILDLKTDTVFIFNAWDGYHYQICGELGLDHYDVENVVGFTAFHDGVATYADLNLDELRSSSSMRRIWGGDLENLRKIDPDG